MSESKAILLTNPRKPDLPSVGKAISEFTNVPLQDAIHAAKSKWGLLEENVDEPRAQQYQAILKKINLDSIIIPTGMVEANRLPHPVPFIRMGASGLEVAAKPNEWKNIPWASISVLAASVFKHMTSRTITSVEGPSMKEKLVKTGIMLTTGIPLPSGRRKTVESKIEEPELTYLLDIFLAQSTLRLRLDANRIDYKFLKEKMQFSAQLNFRVLLKEMVASAPQAILNEGSRVLLEGRPVTSMGYESERDLDQECRWLLTLSKLRK